MCTLNVNISMKHDFKVPVQILLSNVLLLFPVQSENTHGITTELILKSGIKAEQSEGPANAAWSFQRERFGVNRPRFRLDSNSCREISKLTAATFKMPLFLFIFN